MGRFDISYSFFSPDGAVQQYRVELDADSFELIAPRPQQPSEWCRLDFHQCRDCPLEPQSHAYCPAAVALQELVDRGGDMASFQPMRVEVETPERTVSSNTTAQRGYSALMGLLMAVSGCPHTAFFKPMARFHLPLASEEETVYRAVSMYLLAQYFRRRQGLDADAGLDGLGDLYQNIRKVNKGMADRLRAASREDSTVNALILLDMLAMAVPFVVEDSLEGLRHLFTPFTDQPPRTPGP